MIVRSNLRRKYNLYGVDIYFYYSLAMLRRGSLYDKDTAQIYYGAILFIIIIRRSYILYLYFVSIYKAILLYFTTSPYFIVSPLVFTFHHRLSRLMYNSCRSPPRGFFFLSQYVGGWHVVSSVFFWLINQPHS